MLFNSFHFALFLPVVFLLYWFVFDYALRGCRHQLRWQNAFILAASYVFYGCWNWRFLLLIAFTSFCSWGSGLLIQRSRESSSEKSEKKAKCWMVLNIIVNLFILAIFKYYDFFVTEFCKLLHLSTDGLLLKVILPVGISFYTFQALSYSIDIYRGKIEPTKDIIAFFAFISFFPQLVAGPIERATNLLPQFLSKREFNYEQAVDGMRQILWGLFKKIAIADACALYVDQVFSTYTNQSGSTLVLAVALFSIQIYGDFSGYSDIAIGTAKLFGIRLMRNFNNPYFSRDIAEFWRKWHISLTTWFRDYVYIPLGGSRVSKAKIVRNTFVIFLVSGFWHGANWTYIAWGAYHAMLFLPLILLGKNRKYTNLIAEGRILPTWKELGQMLTTFVLVTVGRIMSRSENITNAFDYTRRIFTHWNNPFTHNVLITIVYIAIMLVIEWIQRDKDHALDLSGIQSHLIKYTIYYALIILMILAYNSSENFIYFQF
jgi:D-alanyl-lipoteichoic acid acyltransferase DltB (MBOAT superfamily)